MLLPSSDRERCGLNLRPRMLLLRLFVGHGLLVKPSGSVLCSAMPEATCVYDCVTHLVVVGFDKNAVFGIGNL